MVGDLGKLFSGRLGSADAHFTIKLTAIGREYLRIEMFCNLNPNSCFPCGCGPADDDQMFLTVHFRENGWVVVLLALIRNGSPFCK
jgi:hypothetical protein